MNVGGGPHQRPLRVLHCPWNVGGHPGALARAERHWGLESSAVEIEANPYGFKADETLLLSPMGQIGKELLRLRLLWRAIRHFDVIHFNFGQTILTRCPDVQVSRPRSFRSACKYFYQRQTWLADLPLLKALGKGIVMTYQGDDARQGDECRRRFMITAANHVGPEYYNSVTDAWKRRTIAKVARYADRIYALNPDLLHMLPEQARFLPYANVDPKEWIPPHVHRNEVPVVVHCPTHRGAKGTEFVIRAVQRLRSEKIPFEFELIENLPNCEARRRYERADLLVDQLLIGWYGGLAVEFMALRKPVVCYLRDEDLVFLPSEMRTELPVLNANQDTLYGILRDLLTIRKRELTELGQRSRAYVEKWHDPLRIARKLACEYHTIARRPANACASVVRPDSCRPWARANSGMDEKV
jgi:hypothetical protein